MHVLLVASNKTGHNGFLHCPRFGHLRDYKPISAIAKEKPIFVQEKRAALM